MKRANRPILSSLRLIKSLLQTHPSPSLARSLHIQVTHSTPLFPPHSNRFHKNHNFLKPHHQIHSFSTKSTSFLEIITTNEDWSEELEKKLVESNPVLTHESVMYILKKLDKNSIKAGDFFDWVTKEQGFKPSLPIYNMMLRILGKKRSIRKFWDIVDKMVEEDCDVEGGTYRTVLSNLKGDKMEKDAKSWTKFNFDVEEVSVDGGSKEKKTKKKKVDATGKGVINLVLGADWNEEVKGKLRGFLVTISEATLLRILRGLRTDPLKALCFFRWVEENVGYTHNAVSYNTILLILGQEKTISEFWIVVKKMKSAGCDIDIDTYVKLSRQFQKRKMMKDAVEIYELMMDTPYKPSVGDCTSLLREISLTNTEDLDLVFRVVNKSEAMGQTLSKAVYDEIHGSLTSAGRFDEAEKVLSIMSKSGYKADKVSYSQVMFGLCKEERLDEACQMLDEMESQGCVSDIKTWSIVIQAHCTAGQMDRAMKLFNKMMKKNIGADANLLEVLVNGLCNEKRVGRAYTLVNEMVEKSNLKPWQATYKNLIEQLLEEKMLPEAMNLLRSMMKHKFPAFPKPFGDYISKFGSVKDAVEFLKALSGNQKPYASASAYYQVLHAFLKEGRETDARNLLTKCPDRIQSRPDILNLFTSQMTAVTTA